MSSPDAVEWLKEKYRERGYLVVACHTAKEIGDRLYPEDEFLKSMKWKVIGLSTELEMVLQLPEGTDTRVLAAASPFFYRVEAMD